MKNIILSRKFSFLTTILLILLTLVMYVTFETKCFGSSCNPDFREGFIVPVFWFGLVASAISAFFLFFSQVVFVGWLKRIASWYLPFLFFLTITTPLHSSHVMSVDRSQVVFAGMVVLALISVAYALIMRKKV